MINEILLMASIVVFYGAIVLLYRYFGRTGLVVWMGMATVLANIEVLRMVEAFGMEMTLGNVLFASTFLVTDILSEKEGREYATRVAWLGVITAIGFAVISQSWLLYEPSSSDWAGDSFKIIFSMTPRVVAASVIVFAICQHFDIWLYHKIWALTTRATSDQTRFMWLRNNAATMITQAINTVLYNFGAFWGVYSMHTLISICIGCYLIFIVTSLCDTPALYLARRMDPDGHKAAGTPDKIEKKQCDL